jgi:two-component sensor histidine kinase
MVMGLLAAFSWQTRWRERLGDYAFYGVAALSAIAGIGAMAMQRARRERQAEDALQCAHETLEERVRQRTVELETANGQLAAALTDKEVLIREVQHRVKNNLQVICSLMRLQAARLPEAQRVAFDETLRRVQSMSLVHEFLDRSERPAWLNFGELLRELCGRLAQGVPAAGTRVAVDAADWTIDADRAMPFALIASELVSSSLRHAVSAGRSGHVTVVLSAGVDGMRLSVRDGGGGSPGGEPAAVAAGSRHGDDGGLGLTLVQALARQANARILIDRSDGAAFDLTVPCGG